MSSLTIALLEVAGYATQHRDVNTAREATSPPAHVFRPTEVVFWIPSTRTKSTGHGNFQ